MNLPTQPACLCNLELCCLSGLTEAASYVGFLGDDICGTVIILSHSCKDLSMFCVYSFQARDI